MKDRYLETHKTWNLVAQRYEEKFMDFELYDDTYQLFCDLLPKPDSSLFEIGCGPGNITRHVLNINPKLQILATDVSSNMVDLTKKNNPEAKVQVLDCRKIHSLERQFDGIICGFTIPYLSKADCNKLISNCSSILAKNGVLYLSFVPGDYRDSGYISSNSGERTYFYYHPLQSIKQQLELNQLSITNLIEKEYLKSNSSKENHIILIIRKV